MKAQIDEFFHLVNGTNPTTVLYFNVFRAPQDIHQVFLVAEIAPGAVKIDNMHEISTRRVQLSKHIFQRSIVKSALLIIALPSADNFTIQKDRNRAVEGT